MSVYSPFLQIFKSFRHPTTRNQWLIVTRGHQTQVYYYDLTAGKMWTGLKLARNG